MRHASGLALFILAALPQGAAAQAVGDAGHGRQLFMADGCYECHGTVGQGGVGLRLAPSPPAAVAIAAYIRNPSGEMPPYTSKVVRDSDVQDITTFASSKIEGDDEEASIAPTRARSGGEVNS